MFHGIPISINRYDLGNPGSCRMQEQGTLQRPSERDFVDLRKQGGGQVQNEDQCFTNKLDDMRRLHRFVVAGSESGAYRAQTQVLTKDKIQCLDRLIRDGKGTEAVELIEKISRERRNLRQQPLIYALAVCARSNNATTKAAAYRAFPSICRTPTQLFHFVKFCEELSAPGTGWGRAHKTAIQNWYLRFRDNPRKLLHLVTKYNNREGWTHRDVLRLAHPKPQQDSAIDFIFKVITDDRHRIVEYITEDDDQLAGLKELVKGYFEAKRCSNEEETANLILEYGLCWEHISTEMLNSVTVWKALLHAMPAEAFLRNLGRITLLGLFNENSESEEMAVAKIRNMNTTVEQTNGGEDVEDNFSDDDAVTRRNNRIHPLRIFVALQMYRSGGGIGRGRVTCIPNVNIVRALENAFYRAFQYMEATNKKCLVAVDVSASMSQSVLGMREISCSMVASAIMMTFVRSEPDCVVGGFTTDFTDLEVTNTDMLEEVMRRASQCMGNGGGSNCSAPIKWAMESQIRDIDAFIILTANKNNSGDIHPAEAVRQYRQFAQNPRVKLVACGLCDNDFSIADQNDWYMMDMVGFDLALPHAVAEFIRDND